ncbi:hypothetical protein EMPG_14307 [Blastomyces silverae]|uniref:Uncharacterized protein n=1 Tax=Blastomyces silverae TaxID=2060906 RepID=A0A0H1BFS8_9EURO|nr:hypothetical protein EMPG_14307 [Blastomyces silverae]
MEIPFTTTQATATSSPSPRTANSTKTYKTTTMTRIPACTAWCLIPQRPTSIPQTWVQIKYGHTERIQKPACLLWSIALRPRGPVTTRAGWRYIPVENICTR